MADLERQLHGFRLTTAQIYYHFPDYPELIQEYLWQDYDLAPRFPTLNKFLNFWTERIEGKLHSVYVAHYGLITPGKTRMNGTEISLN
jgi:uncharacterized protein Usg